jgi:D-sedoheptulose 7-phosphate isomerase
MSDSLLIQIRDEINGLKSVLETFPQGSVRLLLEMAAVTAEAIERGNAVYTCGNGGSAADAQHIAGELVGRFRRKKLKGYNAVSLTTNSSIVTALANDYSYDEIFSKQLESQGRSGDILISLSTSGNSPNTVKAAEEAARIGMKTIAFVGSKNGALGDISDYVLKVQSSDFARIQETHMLMGHIFCGLVEEIVVSGS